jgi:hypothetical protein
MHRGLGVQISKVRSLELDEWEPEMVEFMESMGNKKAKEIWEFSLPANYPRITPKSSREDRVKWLKSKYVEKQFADPSIIKKGKVFLAMFNFNFRTTRTQTNTITS